MPLGAVIIAFSIAVISASVAAILFFGTAVAFATAVTVGLALFIVLTTLQLGMAVARLRRTTQNQTADLRETVGHALRQIGTLTERVDQMHAELSDRIEQDLAQLNAELTLVESAVRELDERVDAFAYKRPEPQPAAVVSSAPVENVETRAALQALAGDPPPPLPTSTPNASVSPASDAPSREPTAERDALIQRLAESALADDRAEMCLQPIVTLPQRKVVYYDAITRLKSRDGGVLWPEQYADALENTGGMRDLDAISVPRALSVVRRLTERGRDVSIFVPVSVHSITDGTAFRRLADAFSQSKDITKRVVLSFRQSGFETMGPLEDETILTLRDAGVRLALHDVSDLRFDAHALSRRGIRFVRVPAATILSTADTIPSDIHPADLGGLLVRAGIRLIAGGVAEERTVVDILDYDIELAQGALFSPPRPVRSDILADLTARRGRTGTADG